jgi:predicted Rossmann fold nucleotide-binding protein DprA/Smf involved in DNA uptake
MGEKLRIKTNVGVFTVLAVVMLLGVGCVSDQQIREHREAAEAAMKAAQTAAERVEAAADRVEAAADRAEAAAARAEWATEKCERIFEKGLRK